MSQQQLLFDKPHIEKSKERLANAFKRLEAAITAHLEDLHGLRNSEHTCQELAEELQNVRSKNQELTDQINSLTTDHHELKRTATEVFSLLDHSIIHLESLLTDPHANR